MPDRFADDIAQTNALWGALAAGVLAESGIEEIVLSPGSRSTPLTVACARHPDLRTRVILDERSAGFFALGLARVTGRPAVLICTSGTAAANYLPAVVEAAESGVPLLVLTADRPPELRYRQAGQTIDQIKLFGAHARWFAEAPVPAAAPAVLCAWRELLHEAIATSEGHHPGPVHLNCPLREPLYAPPGPLGDPTEAILPLLRGRPAAPVEQEPVVTLPVLPRQGWIIAGPKQTDEPEAYVRAVGRLADELGWPILADALNPCRHFSDLLAAPVVTTYEAFLRSDGVARRIRPEAILQLGPLPTSKALRQRLADWQLPTVIADAVGPVNAVAAPARHLAAGVESLRVAASTGPRDHNDWHELASLDVRVRTLLSDGLEGEPHTEPAIVAELFGALPPQTPVFIASSMPVRDAEIFWPANADRCPVYFNRGANGIDGTLSTALGVAQAAGRPSVLLTGDLALLHDTNGWLAAGTAFEGSLTVVVINNGGGGIFNHLPIAAETDLFEDFFGTPQPVDLGPLAQAYGVPHELANGSPELLQRLQDLPSHGLQLIEVRTDREVDAAFRKALFRKAQAGRSE